MIKNNKKIPWDYDGILTNKNIKFDELVEYIIEKNNLNKNDWINEIKQNEKGQLFTNESPTLRTLMWNRGITVNDIKKYKEIDWCYDLLSSNCNMSWDFVMENIDKNWDWQMLFSRPTNTWDEIKNFGSLIFEDFDENNILNNFNKSTVMWISQNPNISWDIISNNLHEKWNWDSVTINPNITMKIINDNPDKLWNKNVMYENKNISFEDLRNNNIEITEFQKYEKMFGFHGDCFDF